MSNRRTIGAVHAGYPEVRNILKVPFQNYQVVQRKYDPFKVLDYLYFKAFNRTALTLHNLHSGRGKVDLYHYFNGLSLGRKPWVTTFETYLPRFASPVGFWTRLGIKRLASPACKRLIALSQCAKNIQLEFLKTHYPEVSEIIGAKTEVVHPAQKLMIRKYEEKELSWQLNFTLVGADFFRKGGKEVLEVFDELLTEGHDLKLNIVSRLKYGDYASQATVKDRNWAVDIINKYPANIEWHESLPNPEVLALFKRTHVALLPTYADTYGYAVLEAQANGCPVLSTNIRALPEINHDGIGWLIEVPKYEDGNAKIQLEGDVPIFSGELKKQLRTTLLDLIAHPEQIETKGRGCLDHIRRNHNPATVAARLERIYDEALGD